MHFTLVSAVAALPALIAAAPPAMRQVGTSIPITKRSSLINRSKSVNIDALKAHLATVQTKILRGLDNYEKNTGSSHPSALQGLEKRASGGVPLTDWDDELWYGAISVGTPANTYTVDFDTGSSALFLPGSTCDTSCAGHTIYDPSNSSTSQDLEQTFYLSYGDGSSVSGEQYTDTVSIAGMTATDQTFCVASQYSDGYSLSEFPPDGLMGMGFQQLSDYNMTPVFQTLIDQGQTDEPLFSFKLTSDDSELYIGGANPDLYTGDFSYTPVVTQAYWEVNMDAVVANGQTILRDVDSIIDTGTTVVIGLPDDVATLYQVLGGTNQSALYGQGYYSFPCDAFPDISLTFGGTAFPISNDSLNLGPLYPDSSDCLSGLIGPELAFSFWLVGDVFLTNVYTTFDVGNNRVGFATLA